MSASTLSEYSSSDEQPSPPRRDYKRVVTPPPSTSDVQIPLPVPFPVEVQPPPSQGTPAQAGEEPLPTPTFPKGQAPQRLLVGGANYVLQVDEDHTVDPAQEQGDDEPYDDETDWDYGGYYYDDYYDDGLQYVDGGYVNTSVDQNRCVTATDDSVSVQFPHPTVAQVGPPSAEAGPSSAPDPIPSTSSAQPTTPAPVLQTSTDEVWFPPTKASVVQVDKESVLYFMEGKAYGCFRIVDRVKGTFSLKEDVIIDNLQDFLGECSKEPPTPASSKAAVNLIRARPQINKHLPDRMNAKLEASPPAFKFTKPHPLSPTIIKHLNHHRENRTDAKSLLNVIKNMVVPESKTRFRAGVRPVTPKPPGVMGLLADTGVDPVIDFLCTPTTQAMSFVVDAFNLYGFLAAPSLDLLAILHHLKEQILLMMAHYNGYSALSLATQNVLKNGTFPQAEGCGMREELQGNAQFSQFLYKATAELIENLAKQLGATCMLLRIEVSSSQAAMQIKESLCYASDIVAPHLITTKGCSSVDAALMAGLFKPPLVKEATSLIRSANQKQQQPRGSFHYNHGRQTQLIPSGSTRPGRGRGHGNSQATRGGTSWNRGTNQQRGRGSFRGRGRGGRAGHQGNRGGTNQYQGQYQDNSATNAGGRVPTRPNKPPTTDRSS